MIRYRLRHDGKILRDADGEWVKWTDADAQLRVGQHIIAIVRGQIALAHHTAEHVADDIRVRDGRVEMYCQGEWSEIP